MSATNKRMKNLVELITNNQPRLVSLIWICAGNKVSNIRSNCTQYVIRLFVAKKRMSFTT